MLGQHCGTTVRITKNKELNNNIIIYYLFIYL